MERSASGPMDRRRVLGLMAAGGSALAASLVVGPRRADAARVWCRTDPYIMVGGKHVNVYLERDANEVNISNAPIEVVVTVPKGVKTAVLSQDMGFDFGYRVSFVAGSTTSAILMGGVVKIKVSARVPATSTAMAIRLVTEPTDPRFATKILQGTSNRWLAVDTVV